MIFKHFLGAECRRKNISSLTAVPASIAGDGRGQVAAVWASRVTTFIRAKHYTGDAFRQGEAIGAPRPRSSSMRRRVRAMLTRRKGDVDLNMLVELAEHGNHPVDREA